MKARDRVATAFQNELFALARQSCMHRRESVTVPKAIDPKGRRQTAVDAGQYAGLGVHVPPGADGFYRHRLDTVSS
jgi:hypothetical protein